MSGVGCRWAQKAYFQSAMATEVLSGLVMNLCEIYLDDVIVFADTQLSLI